MVDFGGGLTSFPPADASVSSERTRASNAFTGARTAAAAPSPAADPFARPMSRPGLSAVIPLATPADGMTLLGTQTTQPRQLAPNLQVLFGQIVQAALSGNLPQVAAMAAAYFKGSRKEQSGIKDEAAQHADERLYRTTEGLLGGDLPGDDSKVSQSEGASMGGR